ncbi:MAG: orotidine-5'-phosphate decarboxylase [Candidatus Doudnabacteria bacterium]
MRDERLILALDGLKESRAIELTQLLGQYAYCVKVHDLLDGSDQPEIIQRLKDNGAARVWVDCKLHDIPKTVGRRATALRKAGADIITVHAQGGRDMVKAAVESGLEVLSITVLTSLTSMQIHDMYGRTPAEAVAYFAELAASGGTSGFVCSPLEVESLIHMHGVFKRVVPGTRSVGVAAGDQKRVATPAATLAAGAHHLVIASQVIEASDPAEAWKSLVAEIQTA